MNTPAQACWLKKVVNARFTGARIIDPFQGIDAAGDVTLVDGCVQSIVTETGLQFGDNTDAYRHDEVLLDASGKIICPSFVDIGCSIPEPGFEQKGTFETELAAALAGGYSHLAVLPNTVPIADSPAVVRLMTECAQVVPGINVMPMGALTQGLKGQLLSEMSALKEANCVALTQGYQPIRDLKVLLNALEYAKTHDLLVCFYPESYDLARAGCVHEGATAARLGLPTIPACAETVAVARDLLLIERTGVRAHFSRISAGRSVELIHQAQQAGLPVTADTSILNLIYTDDAISGFNSQFHVRPPLRSEQDRQALIMGIKSGVLSAICSGHTPQERAAKMAPFEATQPGMSTFETQIHWANRLVDSGLLAWSDWIKGMCGASGVLGLAAGSLKVGHLAQFNVIDPNLTWQLDETQLFSRGKNTPLLGGMLKGKLMFQVRGEHSQ